jgi:hypothetical protein
MKKQLSPLLQFFYVVPGWMGLITFILAFVALSALSDSVGGISFILLIIISLVLLFGNNAAVNKISKLKLGLNPKYITEKFPSDLDAQVNHLVMNENFTVSHKTEKTAVLNRKPKLSMASAIVWLLLGILPGIIYLIVYFVKPLETVQLDINSQ